MNRAYKARKETLALYRRCLRSANMIDAKVPGGGAYYSRYSLENIRAYCLEWDEYTIRALLEKGENNRRWIMRKYGLHDDYMDTKVDFIQGTKPKERKLFAEPGEVDEELEKAKNVYADIDIDDRRRLW